MLVSNVNCLFHNFKQYLYGQEYSNNISTLIFLEMQTNQSKCGTHTCNELRKHCNLLLPSQGSRFLQPHTDTPHSHTLLRYRLLQWPLLSTHTVRFRVTLAYSPPVTSVTIHQVPLTSQVFHTSPSSFCANCYRLANRHNLLHYYIMSYNNSVTG